MSDESDRDERDDAGTGEPGEGGPSPSDDGGVPAGGEAIDFSLLDEDRADAESVGEASGASRIDGLPEGWFDSDAVVGRGGSGPLDLLDEADGSPRGAGAIEGSAVSHSSRVLIGTGQSGIVAPSDVLAAVEDVRDGDAVEHRADQGPPLSGAGPEPVPAPTPPGSVEGSRGGDEWGDIVATVGEDVPSESVGFGALLVQDAAERAAASDSYSDDSQGIARGPEESIEVAVPVIAATRPTPPRRGGGLGQVVGVVLGGVLAIPVTLAILLWGFQRDPLGVAKSVPEGMRFMLPRAVRRSVEPRAQPVAGTSLDAIATSAAESLRAESAGGVEAEPLASSLPTTPAADPVAAPPAADPEPLATVPDSAGTLAPDPAPAVGSTPPAVEETAIAIGAPPVAGLGRTVESAPPAVRSPDFGPLDGAVERALLATENLGRLDPTADPQVREQGLVAWYRSLAEAASLLAVAEKEAADGGGSVEAVTRHYEGLAMRLATERVADITDLGTMWLTTGRRPSEGAVLVGTLEESRAAGPWWWGRLAVRGSEPRTVAFFARTLDAVQAGEDVMVTGVLGDASAMWASDVRRVAGSVGRTPSVAEPAELISGEEGPDSPVPSGEPTESPVPTGERAADATPDLPRAPVPPADAPATDPASASDPQR